MCTVPCSLALWMFQVPGILCQQSKHKWGGTSCAEAKRFVQSLLEEQVLVTLDIKSNDLHCIA